MKLITAAAMVCMVAALVVAGLGCGSSGGGGSTTPDLNGTAWKLTAWSVSAQSPADFTITAEFKDGTISGTSAVNTYHGPFTTGPGDAFSVGAVAGTKMAGPEPAMNAETTYLQLLQSAKRYTVEGSTLTLFDANGNEALVYTAK
jgi:heat shock protein HslJ